MNRIELERFLGEVSIERETFEYWIERHWIVPLRTGGAELSDADAARAMFIRDLRDDLGVNDEGIDVVLQLVDQVHGLRRVLQALRVELAAPRGGAEQDQGYSDSHDRD